MIQILKLNSFINGNYTVTFLLIFIIAFSGNFCNVRNPINPNIIMYNESMEMFIAKFYNNHSAAISIAYDSGWPLTENDKEVQKFVAENDIILDYEIVTDVYIKYPQLINYFRQILLPSGFGYFGHGHKHNNHDELSYEKAFESYKLCYETMELFGLKPIAYAYPGGYGFKPENRHALADAGFLCGRMHNIYIYRIVTDNGYSKSRKMVFIK